MIMLWWFPYQEELGIAVTWKFWWLSLLQVLVVGPVALLACCDSLPAVLMHDGPLSKKHVDV